MQTQRIDLTDDMDGAPGARTIYFALEGKHYEIDLTPEHREALRRAMGPYIRAARRRRPPRSRDLVPPHHGPSVRRWAEQSGLPYPRRGFPGRALIEQYNAAHPV